MTQKAPQNPLEADRKDPEMTTAEMLPELSAAQDAFTWHVTKRGRIRARLKNEAEKRVFNAVTAVLYIRTGRFLTEDHWTEAAMAIGLSIADCATIVAASNYDWDFSCRQGTLRHELLGAVGLQTKSGTASSSFVGVLFRGVRSFMTH